MPEKIIANSLVETGDVARKIAQSVEVGDVITLSGDLGVGKTAFAKALINEIMGDETEVTSPTFTIVQDYHGRVPVYHFDLYRLEDKEEIWNIGIEDALADGVCLIEWPEIAADLFSHYSTDIEILYGEHENQRVIVINNND